MRIGNLRVKKFWHRHWAIYKRVCGREYMIGSETTFLSALAKGIAA